MQIKVCGMRRPDNIRAVEALGVDMMGFIFHPRSPRFVGEVPGYLPVRCRRVGVFVDASADDVADRVGRFGLDTVQLHGSESPEYIRRLRALLPAVSVVKAFGVASAADLQATDAYHGLCALFVFDTRCEGHGGSGRAFDWSVLDAYRGPTPFLLSGGIGPRSAEALLGFRHPMMAGLDLNSRFETSPGVKDTDALAAFLEAIAKRKHVNA